MQTAHKIQILIVAIALPAAAAFFGPSFAGARNGPPSARPVPALPDPPAPTAKAEPARDKGEWRESLLAAMKEHPRIARALMQLHEARGYIERSPHDFGGRRGAAVESIDGAIGQLEEVMKNDVKKDDRRDTDASEKAADKK